MVSISGDGLSATYRLLAYPFAARTTRAGSRCLLGLAPTGGYRATPVARRAVALTPPFHPYPLESTNKGRSVLCGPVRRLAAPRRYLAVYPCGARTFLGCPYSRPSATTAPHHLPRRESYRPAGPGGRLTSRDRPDQTSQTVCAPPYLTRARRSRPTKARSRRAPRTRCAAAAASHSWDALGVTRVPRSRRARRGSAP